MATKKKRLAGRAVKKRAGRKRVAAKRAKPKRRSSATRRRAIGREGARKKRASKSAAVRRKERKVDDARHELIEAEKELAVEELPIASTWSSQLRASCGSMVVDRITFPVARSLIAGGLSTPFRDASAGVMVLFAVVHLDWLYGAA
jgi:hypothetical protein